MADYAVIEKPWYMLYDEIHIGVNQLTLVSFEVFPIPDVINENIQYIRNYCLIVWEESMTQTGAEIDPNELVRSHNLPDPDWDEYYDRIYVDSEIKEKLVNYGLLLERFDQAGLDQMTLGYHGAVLLYGPPGTGKTTLAKGVANKVAQTLESDVIFRQVDVEYLFSGRLGDTPKAVSRVFNLLIESANSGTKQVVLFDEVESLISDRGALVGETDPMDVARAVNVALEMLDELAEYSNVYLISTSNLPSAVDSAFFDRADVHFEIGNPDHKHRTSIFVDIFEDLNQTLDTNLPTEDEKIGHLVDVTESFSGRRIRKVVLEAIAADTKTIYDPSQLTFNQVYNTISNTRSRLVSEPAKETKRTELFESEERTSTESADLNSETSEFEKFKSVESSKDQPDDSEASLNQVDEWSEDEPNSPKETTDKKDPDLLFSRKTAVDSLENKPEEKMLTRVATLFKNCLSETGYNTGHIESNLLSDAVVESVTIACSQEVLYGIALSIGHKRIEVDIEYVIDAAEPITPPLDDVTTAIPDSEVLKISFLVDETINDDHPLYNLAENRNAIQIKIADNITFEERQ